MLAPRGCAAHGRQPQPTSAEWTLLPRTADMHVNNHSTDQQLSTHNHGTDQKPQHTPPPMAPTNNLSTHQQLRHKSTTMAHTNNLSTHQQQWHKSTTMAHTNSHGTHQQPRHKSTVLRTVGERASLRAVQRFCLEELGNILWMMWHSRGNHCASHGHADLQVRGPLPAPGAGAGAGGEGWGKGLLQESRVASAPSPAVGNRQPRGSSCHSYASPCADTAQRA